MAEQLTRKDVERIEREIEHRRLVVRPAGLEAVKEARAQGDLSENFEYYAAKRDKNKNGFALIMRRRSFLRLCALLGVMCFAFPSLFGKRWMRRVCEER